MSVNLRRVLSLGRTSSVGDSDFAITVDDGDTAGAVPRAGHVQRVDSVGSVKSGAKSSTKKLLSVFGGFEGRRSLDGKKRGDKLGDKLNKSIELKKSGRFSSLETDEVDDESPLIKAGREVVNGKGENDGHGGQDGRGGVQPVRAGEQQTAVPRQTIARTSSLSQMTTHDDMFVQEWEKGTVTSLADASSVDVVIGSLKRTLEESEECMNTTSTDEVFVDTDDLLREASIAHKLVEMERRLDVFGGQLRRCLVAAMKMELISGTMSGQIHRMASSATKAQMDTESRLSILAGSLKTDESLARQLTVLESKVKEVRAQLSRLEDEFEQEQTRKREVETARQVQAVRVQGEKLRGALMFVARRLAVPILVIALAAVRSRTPAAGG